MKSLLCVTDLSGNFVKVNVELSQILGYEESELIGKPITDLIHPDDAEVLLPSGANSVQTLPDQALLFLHKKGHSVSIHWQGTIDYTQGLIYNVSVNYASGELMKNILEKNAHLLQILAESSHIGIALSDLNRKLIYVNPAFESLVGYSVEELEGLDWNVFTHHYDEEQTQKKYKQVVNGSKEVVQINQRCFHRTGQTVWTTMLLSKIWDEESQQEVVISLITKVNEEEKLQLSLQKLNLVLDSRVKMLNQRTTDLEKVNRQLEQFVYVASHDLQEPLRTVNNYLGLLMEEKEAMLDTEGKQYVERIGRASKRLSVLLSDLLNYSRVGRRKEDSWVDTHKVVQNVLEDLHIPITESQANIQIGALPKIYGSEKDMHTLFQNLIGNAIKFRKKEVAPEVLVSSKELGDVCVFHVSDNGIGIAKKHYSKIFTIFQRLHHQKDYQGTGIGLALCKRIVSAYKGSITVESELDKGSTFHVTIPIHPSS